MNRRVDGTGEDAVTVPEAAGHERRRLGCTIWHRVLPHEPVVAVLFLTAACTTISGEPVHGVLLGLIA